MKNYQLYITIILFFVMGFLLGMIVQQGIFQGTMMKVAGSLDGVEVDINFNETMMIDAMMDNFEEIGLFNYTNETIDASYTEGEK